MQGESPTPPFGVTTTECPACLGLPECTAGCEVCGGTGEVEAPPGCSYCQAELCQCAAVERQVDRRLEDEHYLGASEEGWSA
jgi:hypothetical protein